MDLKDYFTLGIAILALVISFINFLRERKKSGNVLMRLIILTESIKSDFDQLKFDHSMIHLLPGFKNEEFQIPFNAKMKSLESKVSTYYDLLLQNQKISDFDVKKILKGLSVIEENLFELTSYPVDKLEDLETTRAFINPIIKEIEIIESVVQQYEI